ncbi:Hypothetical protein PHPALM_17050 [Phytophthora palmivora]|uniref:Integrase catalytic domain-containing protein n=1 Tax=Phytophthora palmivora TaxID=4796 RepID=A0A2P4XN73_9STRA|nr:Hypothetical protein PHPALM_17050 [Phytophthora palmivora]
MPHMSSLLEHTKGKIHFGLFDLLKGFWQLPLDKVSQELMSYITDSKIYTPRRVPQGCCDAAVHFQQTMGTASSRYYDNLLFAEDIDTYLIKLEKFFGVVEAFGLKLSALKSSLYQQKVKWCGRVICKDGISHDPARIDTLRSMSYPTTAGQSQQFLCATNWVRDSPVDYARAVHPLQQGLDMALKQSKHTKRVAAGISIQLSQSERKVFDHVNDLLATSATLAVPDDTSMTCVFTDASDTGFAVLITQVFSYDPKVPITSQQHKLLTCLSGTFSGAQLNWTVLEKEAYPIVVACDKLDYLLLNLIHVFVPHTSVKKHIKRKLLRWALKLMSFRYIIEHVDGVSNVWVDMLSRWAGQPTTTVKLKRLTRRRGSKRQTSSTERASQVLRPLGQEGFTWPTLEEFRTVQRQHQAPAGAVRDKTDVLRVDQRIWVPRDCSNLTQGLLMIAHCGAQGHRGEQAMVNHLRRLFHIPGMRNVVHTFVSARVFWKQQILASAKGSRNTFCELVECDAADSSVATAAIQDWYSQFGAPPVWVSDNGSHFKSEVVSELSKRLKTQQNFTLAYCPWINGSVERVNRDILQVLRTMILEYNFSTKDWVYLVPRVQTSLNHTALPSLGNRAPVELFTGLPCPSPLAKFYDPSLEKLVTLPKNSAAISKHLGQLRTSLCAMPKPIADQRLKQRLLNKKKERGENVVNFDVGDYVLRSRVDEKRGNKLPGTWQGPYKVLRADSHSFKIRHLVTGEELDVHASRLKFYADDEFNTTEEILEHVADQGIILAINEFKQHRWNSSINDYEVLVSWTGLESIEELVGTPKILSYRS